MNLYYYQPDGHGPVSFFVLAESAEKAAEYVNKYWKPNPGQTRPSDTYSYYADDFVTDDFSVAAVGEVIENDNA